MRSHVPAFEGAGPDRLDSRLKDSTWSKNMISCLYNTLQNIDNIAPTATRTIPAEREAELGRQSSEGIWDKSLDYIHTGSVNARHRQMQFKVLHRLHCSVAKLHRMFPEMPFFVSEEDCVQTLVMFAPESNFFKMTRRAPATSCLCCCGLYL